MLMNHFKGNTFFFISNIMKSSIIIYRPFSGKTSKLIYFAFDILISFSYLNNLYDYVTLLRNACWVTLACNINLKILAVSICPQSLVPLYILTFPVSFTEYLMIPQTSHFSAFECSIFCLECLSRAIGLKSTLNINTHRQVFFNNLKLN